MNLLVSCGNDNGVVLNLYFACAFALHVCFCVGRLDWFIGLDSELRYFRRQ